jgi:hypothetical protein
MAILAHMSGFETANMLSLREIVEKYRAHAGGSFDEDYHISRFFEFTFDRTLAQDSTRTYRINGFAQSHVSIAREVETIL